MFRPVRAARLHIRLSHLWRIARRKTILQLPRELRVLRVRARRVHVTRLAIMGMLAPPPGRFVRHAKSSFGPPSPRSVPSFGSNKNARGRQAVPQRSRLQGVLQGMFRNDAFSAPMRSPFCSRPLVPRSLQSERLEGRAGGYRAFRRAEGAFRKAPRGLYAGARRNRPVAHVRSVTLC